MIELRPRPREDLPGLVAMLAEAHEVVVGRRPHRRQRFGVGPPGALHQPHPALAARRQRQRLGTAGVLQHGKRLAPKNVRVSRELEEGYGGVEVVASIGEWCRPTGLL